MSTKVDSSKKGTVIHGEHGSYTLLDGFDGGGNGTIYDVEIKRDNGKIPNSDHGYVIKVLKYDQFKAEEKEKRLERFRREINTIQRIYRDDLRVIPIWDSFLKESSSSGVYWYLMPKASKALSSRKKSVLKIMQEFWGLGKTLCRIHGNIVSHRDIKPDNILFYKGKNCFTDFGLSWEENKSVQVTGEDESIGPYFIRPPELEISIDRMAFGREYYKSDVYLFVKTLWIMLTGDNRGFRGEYKRSDPSICLNNDSLNLGETIEPLHIMMEKATLFDYDNRISMEECCRLIDSQIKIAERNLSKEIVESLRYEENIQKIENTIPSDFLKYSSVDGIIKTLNILSGVTLITLLEYEKEIFAGKLVNAIYLGDRVFEITINGMDGTEYRGEKKVLANIQDISISSNRDCSFSFGELPDSMKDNVGSEEPFPWKANKALIASKRFRIVAQHERVELI